MADFYFSLPGGLTALFRTACALGPHERLQLGAYVPGIAALDKPPAQPDITLFHETADRPRLEDGGAHVALYAPAGEKLPADLYHLFYGVARRELLKRGFYTVHAACVGRDDAYTLIVGPSGAGKTTLAHKLVETHGLKLFSGNKTVVRFDRDGGIRAVAGTKTMTALDGGLNRHAYEMNPDDYAQQTEVEIKSILLVRINDGVEETQTLTPLSALHSLYPCFMDAVNADIIVNGRDLLDGTPDRQTRQALGEKLGRAVSRIPVRKYAGTVKFLEHEALRQTVPALRAGP